MMHGQKNIRVLYQLLKLLSVKRRTIKNHETYVSCPRTL